MTQDTKKPGKTADTPPTRAPKDIVLDSYRKETAKKGPHEARKQAHRSAMNAPVDPNALTADMDFPPGVSPEDAADPGRATPGAPPVKHGTGDKQP